jgi:hypothetical protein
VIFLGAVLSDREEHWWAALTVMPQFYALQGLVLFTRVKAVEAVESGGRREQRRGGF